MTHSSGMATASQAGKRARGDANDTKLQVQLVPEMFNKEEALSKQRDELLTSFLAHVAGLEAQHSAERDAWRAEMAAGKTELGGGM